MDIWVCHFHFYLSSADALDGPSDGTTGAIRDRIRLYILVISSYGPSTPAGGQRCHSMDFRHFVVVLYGVLLGHLRPTSMGRTLLRRWLDLLWTDLQQLHPSSQRSHHRSNGVAICLSCPERKQIQVALGGFPIFL